MRIDRRVHDSGPPQGSEERRRLPERRYPEVVHADFDECIDMPPLRFDAA
ncbi:MAG TPA: hypothetical protein PKE50_02380 [Rhodocyclaceae bacterium]|nr:hypothetical protein [Rhodocyclaceae bacterium]